MTPLGNALTLAPRAPFVPTRADWLQAALIALTLFALYAATSPHTVALEDDGLFILSSYFLGVEHPPGYPLHTLLGRLFTLLPVSTVAYRVHLLSAVLGGLTCAGVWLCARALIDGRLPAYVAALGLGVSRTFWSQAIIAEVYTFNTLFLFVLLNLVLAAAPADPADLPRAPGAARNLLPLIAFIFGLSLSNHWPLMLLAAPGLAVLLLPRAREVLRRMPLLLSLFVLGLLPYAWMVLLSWAGLIISFDGPLQSLREFWFFVSRAGYASVDVSPTATWLDRVGFFEFLGAELLVQFAIVGTLLAGVGFWVQWRAWGRRVSWGLTLAFLGPSAVLLLLLGFDYDSLHKHMFHVYPLPSYGIAALWMGLGFAWLVRRLALRTREAAAACTLLVGLTLAVGARHNLLSRYDWAARYAHAILQSVPKDSILIVRGDPDLAPIGYFHMIEGQRPDITLYQPQGLILGNRLFHPLRTSPQQAEKLLGDFIKRSAEPVVATDWNGSGYAQRDCWLYSVLDAKSPASESHSIAVPEGLVHFFEDSILAEVEGNAWAAVVQGNLRRHYARLLAETMPRDKPLPARTQRDLEALSKDYFGALGVVEGLLANKQGYSATQAIQFLDAAEKLMPSDASKEVKARYFELRAYLRLGQKDEPGAIEDLETAVSMWPVKLNSAVPALSDLYAQLGRQDARNAMLARLKQ